VQHVGAILAIDDDHRAIGMLNDRAAERDRRIDGIAAAVAANVKARAEALALRPCLKRHHRHRGRAMILDDVAKSIERRHR